MVAKTQILAFMTTEFMKYTQEANSDLQVNIKSMQKYLQANIDTMRDVFTCEIAHLQDEMSPTKFFLLNLHNASLDQ